MEPRLKSSLDAKLLLKPLKSQIFLTTLLLLSFALCGGGIFFLWHEKPNGELIFFSGLLLIIVSFIGWLTSKDSSDLDQATPTTISNNGMQLTTDAKSIRSASASKNMIDCIQAMISREELPPAAGIVDEDGNVHSDEESLKKAQKVTDEINGLTKMVNNRAAKVVSQSFVVQENDDKFNEIMAESIIKNNLIDQE
nr:hypothetical protein [Providencia rettgeri]